MARPPRVFLRKSLFEIEAAAVSFCCVPQANGARLCTLWVLKRAPSMKDVPASMVILPSGALGIAQSTGNERFETIETI